MNILYKAYEWIKDAQDQNSNQENDFYFAPRSHKHSSVHFYNSFTPDIWFAERHCGSRP